MLTAALATVLYTWVYNHSGGSILIAMLMHAASNAATGWLTTLLKDTQLGTPTLGWVAYMSTMAGSTSSPMGWQRHSC
jgi:membrane protease YdiL (CAAX protease family)